MSSGWQNNPPFNIDEAQQRGVDVYEVLVTEWGRPFAPGSPVLVWPPGLQSVPVSLAGIAIGPRSTVDRAWVSYNLQKQKLQGIDPQTVDRVRRLSLDSPLIFTQASNPGALFDATDNVVNNMTRTGLLKIYSYADEPATTFLYPNQQDSTILPGNYIDALGQEQDWGGSPDTFMYPTLHLYLYLKAPQAFVPSKRFPLQLSGFVDSGLANGTEVRVASIPTFGRKTISFQFVGGGDGGGTATTYDYRVDALRALAPTTLTYAAPVDVIAGVAAGVPAINSACAGQNVNADYINLYVTAHGGTGVVNWTLTAYD